MTKNIALNIDAEEAELMLVKIEKSFDIKTGDTEPLHIKSFG